MELPEELNLGSKRRELSTAEKEELARNMARQNSDATIGEFSQAVKQIEEGLNVEQYRSNPGEEAVKKILEEKSKPKVIIEKIEAPKLEVKLSEIPEQKPKEKKLSKKDKEQLAQDMMTEGMEKGQMPTVQEFNKNISIQEARLNLKKESAQEWMLRRIELFSNAIKEVAQEAAFLEESLLLETEQDSHEDISLDEKAMAKIDRLYQGIVDLSERLKELEIKRGGKRQSEPFMPDSQKINEYFKDLGTESAAVLAHWNEVMDQVREEINEAISGFDDYQQHKQKFIWLLSDKTARKGLSKQGVEQAKVRIVKCNDGMMRMTIKKVKAMQNLVKLLDFSKS